MLTWLIYLILQPLQELSILNPFLQPTTQDQKLTAKPGRYAIKLVPTVTCSLQPSDPKLPTNHISKNYLKTGKENIPQTKSWDRGNPHLYCYDSLSIKVTRSRLDSRIHMRQYMYILSTSTLQESYDIILISSYFFLLPSSLFPLTYSLFLVPYSLFLVSILGIWNK